MSNKKNNHIDILLDLIKSSEKEEVSKFSKNLINLYNCISTDKDEAAQLTMNAVIKIICPDNKSKINKKNENNENLEKKSLIIKSSDNKELKDKKSFLAVANLGSDENSILINKVKDVVKKTDSNFIEVNGSSYKKEEDSRIVITSYIKLENNKSENIFSITGYTELSVNKNSFTVPHLNMYLFDTEDKTKILDTKIENKKLEPVTSNLDLRVVLYDRVVSTKGVYIIPFSNYPKGTNDRHRFLNAYDNEFSFSETEIYNRYHTSITPGFISSIESHKGGLWKIGIKYIYAKENKTIHTKFIHCLLSDKIKNDYNINIGDILITGNIVCHNNKTGSDKNAYCTSMILALHHDAAGIMFSLKRFKSDLKKTNRYKSFLSDIKNKFKLEKWILPFVECIFEDIKPKNINIKNKENNEGFITVDYKGEELKFDLKEIFNFGKNENDFKNEKKRIKFLKDINNIHNLRFKISSIDNQSYFLNYY